MHRLETRDWKDIEGYGKLDGLVSLGFKQSEEFPHAVRQQNPSDILQPLQTPASLQQGQHEPHKSGSAQPPAAKHSDTQLPAAVGSNPPSEHSPPPVIPTPPVVDSAQVQEHQEEQESKTTELKGNEELVVTLMDKVKEVNAQNSDSDQEKEFTG